MSWCGLEPRFADKIIPVTECGCWVWTGAVKTNGYGSVLFSGKNRPAHRVIYETLVREIPAGLQMDHLCRNRLCVNPDHLEPVSQAENMLRGWKSRGKNLVGQQFGRLEVISRVENGKNDRAQFLCRCSCGTEKIIRASDLKHSGVSSCGCKRVECGRTLHLRRKS